ncbi:hypothetical protein Tco_1199493, partial [Tanacetum coccineum]
VILEAQYWLHGHLHCITSSPCHLDPHSKTQPNVEAKRSDGLEAKRSGLEAKRSGLEAKRSGLEAKRSGLEAKRNQILKQNAVIFDEKKLIIS